MGGGAESERPAHPPEGEGQASRSQGDRRTLESVAVPG